MKFLAWDHIYVDNMFSDFEGKKIYIEKDIWNLPACVVMRNNFTTTNYDTLPRAENLFIDHENFGMESSLS